MTFMIIPYILGIAMAPNRAVENGLLEYTFQVDARWWFSDFKEWKENVYLSVDLKCHQVRLDVSCRLEKWRVRQQAQTATELGFPIAVYLDRITEQEDLQKDSTPFHIVFNRKGVTGYFLESKAVPKRMMNMYRIIGNQLNIGVNLKQKGNAFEDVEQSNVGFCLARCTKITLEPPLNGPIANLTSFAGYDLTKNMITIFKRKIISRCAVVKQHFAIASFWPDLFPKAATSYVLKNSVSSMTMSSRNFETLTDNEYNLYDKNKTIVGDMSEEVKLYMKSYRLLPSDSFITMDKDEIVFYKVLNEEAA